MMNDTTEAWSAAYAEAAAVKEALAAAIKDDAARAALKISLTASGLPGVTWSKMHRNMSRKYDCTPQEMLADLIAETLADAFDAPDPYAAADAALDELL